MPGADSSPAASSGVGPSSVKEAFAECLRLAENKQQEIAALHLLDASTAERDQLRQQVKGLLGQIDALLTLRNTRVAGRPYLPDNWESRGRLQALDAAADQVRKELGE
jgi:hypothetical protein